MISLKKILVTLAFAIAFIGAHATSSSHAVHGYIKIGTGNFPSECVFSEKCRGFTIVCTNAQGLTLHGLNSTQTSCNIVLFESFH